ncbi:competence pheromone ComX [Schinkia azotoformans]|uniref:competence pheromone ComX n=1 Tax=Schinkia azotoformans TaxID=1454 RepID=UPI002E23A377|nr:competence pheromone ComX [Schinkia azotoformans]
MISEIIQHLVKNQEVLEQVQNGFASIIGVSEEEVQIILDVLNGTVKTLSNYWL